MRLKERIPPRNESSTQLAFYVITGICMINFKEHGCTIARVDLSCKVCILLVVLGVKGVTVPKRENLTNQAITLTGQGFPVIKTC